MCFFDQHVYECGDSRLGKFRQHCERETRAGKTCGTKTILETTYLDRKCAICDQIDEKLLQRSKDVETIEKLMSEGGQDRPALEAAIDSIQFLDFDMRNLRRERDEKRSSSNDDLPPYTPPSPRANLGGFHGLHPPQQPLLPGIDLNQVSPATLALLASSLLQTERVVYQRQELFFGNSNPGSTSHSPLRGQSPTINLSSRPLPNDAPQPSSISSPFVSRHSSTYVSRNNSAHVSRSNSPFVSRTTSPMPSSAAPEPRTEVPPFVSLVRAPTYKEEDPNKGKGIEQDDGEEDIRMASPTSPNQETSKGKRRESSEFLPTNQDNRSQTSLPDNTSDTEREDTVTWKCKCGETFVSSRSSGIEDIASLHICDKTSRPQRSRTPSPLRFWRNKSAGR